MSQLNDVPLRRRAVACLTAAFERRILTTQFSCKIIGMCQTLASGSAEGAFQLAKDKQKKHEAAEASSAPAKLKS